MTDPDVTNPFGDQPDEFRLDAEAAEADALMAMRRGRSLTDVATDLAHRGRVVEVVAGAHRVRGEARGAGEGVLLVDVAAGRIGVSLAAVQSLADLGRTELVTTIERPGTWRAWLTGLEGRAGVEVGLTDDTSLVAVSLLAVASDHLLTAAPMGESAIAIDHVAVVLIRG